MAETQTKKIFVYAESPPLHEDVATHGLYRAGTPILSAIRDRIAMIALYPMDRRYRLDSMDPRLRPLGRSLPLAFTLFRAVRKRIPFLKADFENSLVAEIVGDWAQRAAATEIFALEGSDPEVLARVDAIAARAGKPFSVYLVDDFAWTMRLGGASETKITAVSARMKAILARAQHVFAITDELGELLRAEFGVRPTTLGLAFEPKPRPSPAVKDQIIFLGSVNFLYVDALLSLIEIVDRIRTETGCNLVIRFTSKGGLSELGALPDFVTAGPIPGAEALAQEIAASMFAFLPYSFDEKLRTMVSTSFPSKSMEYLAYARSIVVHAPEYSNSARFFARSDLPTVTVSRQSLEQTVRQHLRDHPNHSARYRDYLAHYHSPAAVRQTIVETLGLGGA